MREWQQIEEITMAVRTMDVALSDVGTKQEISASCTLVNIARGHSLVTMSASSSARKISGTATILVHKPVMQVAIILPKKFFDHVIKLVTQAVSRPISIRIGVDQALAVSLEGDLRIDEEMVLKVTDCSITIPLK